MTDSSERDENLVYHGFITGTRTFRNELREWVQGEILAYKFKAEAIEPTLTGELKRQVRQARERLDEIDRRELREAVDNIDTKCSEINDGAWDNVLDVRPYLEEGLSRFERLVRDLLTIRKFLDSLWE